MSSTSPQVTAPGVDVEETTRTLRSIVDRFLPDVELVAIEDVRGKIDHNRETSRRFPDRYSEYYVRTGDHTYRVYVRGSETDDPPKAVNISTAERRILSLQG